MDTKNEKRLTPAKCEPWRSTTNPLVTPKKILDHTEIAAKHMLLDITGQIYEIWPQFCRQFLCKHELAIRNEGTGQAYDPFHTNTETQKV